MNWIILGNECLQWATLGLLLWSSSHMADATSQLQRFAKRNLDQEIDTSMKRIKETETFQ